MRLSKQLWAELVTQSTAFCLLVVSIVLFWRDNSILSTIVAAECLVAWRSGMSGTT